MDHPLIFFSVLLWMIAWGTIGSIVTPRRYLRKDLDVSQAPLAGAAIGAATGPFGLIPLWLKTPKVKNLWLLLSFLMMVLIFIVAFAISDPDNLCVANPGFVASQFSNGLIIGFIYGLMALGLTLIFSILGIVSFAHGEFYMIGGMVVFYFNKEWVPGSSPLLAILAACVVTFVIGALFERIFLQPMHSGKVDRPGEYAILVTFGLAFFLQYLVQAVLGANPVKARRFFDFPQIAVPSADNPWLMKTSKGTLTLFENITISSPRFSAAIISVIMLLILLFFLYRTWTGKALRAVSQDRQAASVAGINPKTMNTLTFALGCMLAGLSGATLVQAFAWLPQVGVLASLRSFVIIVLGGMGSFSGAFLGGLIVGLVEAAGTGCIPDPTRAAAYIPAYGMIILTLVLLLKPTGLFGREQ